MAHEMGLKEFEEKMMGPEKKQATITKFTRDKNYNILVRLLI
jgi:hypothetical protein